MLADSWPGALDTNHSPHRRIFLGYDAHITRSRDWAKPKQRITADEWSASLEQRPDLSGWLHFDDGVISAKNPTHQQLGEMIALATGLKAHVQGDDGELYSDPSQAPTPYTPGVFERLGTFFGRFSNRRQTEAEPAPFAVGVRVRSPIRGEGTVVSVDPAAEHGLGRIVVGFDDGGELAFSCVAHGLEEVEGHS